MFGQRHHAPVRHFEYAGQPVDASLERIGVGRMRHEVVPLGIQASDGGCGAVDGFGQRRSETLADDRDGFGERIKPHLPLFEHLVELGGGHAERIGNDPENAGNFFPELFAQFLRHELALGGRLPEQETSRWSAPWRGAW